MFLFESWRIFCLAGLFSCIWKCLLCSQLGERQKARQVCVTFAVWAVCVCVKFCIMHMCITLHAVSAPFSSSADSVLCDSIPTFSSVNIPFFCAFKQPSMQPHPPLVQNHPHMQVYTLPSANSAASCLSGTQCYLKLRPLMWNSQKLHNMNNGSGSGVFIHVFFIILSSISTHTHDVALCCLILLVRVQASSGSHPYFPLSSTDTSNFLYSHHSELKIPFEFHLGSESDPWRPFFFLKTKLGEFMKFTQSREQRRFIIQ